MTPAPRRRRTWLIATVLLGALFTAPAGAQAAETVVSQGKPATASSSEWAGTYRPTAAVDGNTGTRWSSAFSDPQWLQVDLGATHRISRVALNWEAAYAGPSRSRPPPTAPTRPRLRDHHRHRRPQTITVSGTGRYVRVNVTAARHPLRLLALGVPGLRRRRRRTRRPDRRPGPAARTLLSYNKPATRLVRAERREVQPVHRRQGVRPRPGQPLGDQFDHRLGRPGWISVDLGATARSARSSCNGTRRTPGRTRSRSRATARTGPHLLDHHRRRRLKDVITVTGSGRYVRMYGTARSQRLRILAVGVQRVRHRRQPDRTRPPSRPTRPSRPPGWSSTTSSTRGRHQLEHGQVDLDPGPAQNGEVQYYTNSENALGTAQGNWSSTPVRRSRAVARTRRHRMNTGNKFPVQYGRVDNLTDGHRAARAERGDDLAGRVNLHRVDRARGRSVLRDRRGRRRVEKTGERGATVVVDDVPLEVGGPRAVRPGGARDRHVRGRRAVHGGEDAGAVERDRAAGNRRRRARDAAGDVLAGHGHLVGPGAGAGLRVGDARGSATRRANRKSAPRC